MCAFCVKFCGNTALTLETFWPYFLTSLLSEGSLRGWGPDSGRWGRFMKAVKLLSDPTKTKIYKRLAL